MQVVILCLSLILTNQGKDLKELEGSLDAITKQAQTMIEGLKKH